MVTRKSWALAVLVPPTQAPAALRNHDGNEVVGSRYIETGRIPAKGYKAPSISIDACMFITLEQTL